MSDAGLKEYFEVAKSLAAPRSQTPRIETVDDVLDLLMVAITDFHPLTPSKPKSWADIDQYDKYVKTFAFRLGQPEIKQRLALGDYTNFIVDRRAGFVIFDTDYGGHEATLEILWGLYHGEDHYIPKEDQRAQYGDDLASLAVTEGIVIYLPSQSDALLRGEDVRLTAQEKMIFREFRIRTL